MKRELMWLSAIAVLIMAGLALAGRFVPWISPDTPSYFDLGGLPEALGRSRNPLYAWLVGWWPAGFAALPTVQIALYMISVVLLHRALRIYGVSVMAASAVSAGLLISNVLLLWSNAVHPEFPAVALALLSLAQLLLLAAGRPFLPNALGLGLTLGLAYILRPTFLPGMLLYPVLYLALRRVRGNRTRAAAVLGVLLACAIPFLAMSSIRFAAVRDFNIVSFGGFQMAGMAGLMLSPELIERMPSDVQPLAKQILERRTRAEERGEVIATPLNSTGQRSFVSAALGYYDLYARTYDTLLYGEIAKLQGNEDWVSWNKKLMRFSIATVLAAPDRYVAWLVGGTSRAVGRLFVTNLPFMLGLIGLIAVYCLSLWRGAVRPAPSSIQGLDIHVILLLTLVYTVAAGALMVIVTFPAARYLDSAGLLLPALPIYLALSLALRR
jgi:hypothetical protein